MTDKRVQAFRNCLLNTIVQAFRPVFEGLTLSNCLESDEFRAGAILALSGDFFRKSIEPAMETARKSLIKEIEEYQ